MAQIISNFDLSNFDMLDGAYSFLHVVSSETVGGRGRLETADGRSIVAQRGWVRETPQEAQLSVRAASAVTRAGKPSRTGQPAPNPADA